MFFNCYYSQYLINNTSISREFFIKLYKSFNYANNSIILLSMSYQVKSKIAEVIAKCFNNNSGIMLKDQKIQSEFQSDKINELIKYYGDKKTSVNLIELLSPSVITRAK